MPDIGNLVLMSVIPTLVIIVLTFVLVLGGIYYFSRQSRKKAEALLATGKHGTARVLSLEDTGMRINDNPRVRMLLEVDIPGYASYQVQKTVTIPMIKIAQVQVGSIVNVMADPTQPNNPDKLGLLLA